MKYSFHKHFKDPRLPWVLALIIALGFSIWIYFLYQENAFVTANKIRLEQELVVAEEDNRNLLEKVAEQEATINSFTDQIQNIGRTVGTLEKLSKTDEELLQKYSKIYFLNENYVPSRLADIGAEYLYNPDSDNTLIHADVWPFLKRLLDAAGDQGVKLRVASAFRSFGTQAALKGGYTVLYGYGANQFSADQGYSEHQLGTALDFTTPEVGASFSKFESDTAYKWLTDNAHKYGFILSYPKGNTYYKFEPWHWRFVGVELATRLHDEGKYFYDLDQREIDTYLIKIFD